MNVLQKPAISPEGHASTMMQLNPFALPAETQGRFRMLVVAALSAALNIGLLWSSLAGREPQLKPLWDEHEALWRQAFDSTFHKLTLAERQVLGERAEALIKAMLEILLADFSTVALYVLGLSAFALFIYRRHPQRIRKKFGALPLSEEQAPKVVRHLKNLIATLGVSPAPSLEYSTSCLEILGAQTFGLKNSPALLLKEPPELLEQAWDDKHTAVVLHELGHIMTGDAQTHEKARAIWMALLVLGYLPLLFVLLLGSFNNHTVHPSHQVTLLGLQFVFTCLMLYTIKAGLSRTRELYADWRVVASDMGSILAAILTAPALDATGWWRNHPSYEVRRATLERPESSFRISSDLPLQTGFLLALVLGNALMLGGMLFKALWLLSVRAPWRVLVSLSERPAGWKSSFEIMAPMQQSSFLLLLVTSSAFFLLSRVVSGSLDLQVQREAVADLATGRHENWGYLKLLRPAFLLAVGFETGLLLTPASPLLPQSQDVLWWLPNRIVVMGLFSWIWLVSARASSRLFLGPHAAKPTKEPPKQHHRAAWLSSLIFTLLCWPLGAASLSLSSLQKASIEELQASALPPGLYSFYYFGMPVLWVLFFTTVIYVFVGGLALALASMSLFTKIRSCPTCEEIMEPKLAVGRRCHNCSQPLSLWLYLQNRDVRRHEPAPQPERAR